MIELRIPVGLVVVRHTSDSQWGGVAWQPVTVFETPPDVAPWTPLGGSARSQRFYAGEVTLHVYSTDTANYRDNLESGAPKLWVALSASSAEPPITVIAVTADPAEGEALTETGTNAVDVVDMPQAIAATLAGFIAEHHVERPVLKRKRDRAEPEVTWRRDPGKPKPGKV